MVFSDIKNNMEFADIQNQVVASLIALSIVGIFKRVFFSSNKKSSKNRSPEGTASFQAEISPALSEKIIDKRQGVFSIFVTTQAE